MGGIRSLRAHGRLMTAPARAFGSMPLAVSVNQRDGERPRVPVPLARRALFLSRGMVACHRLTARARLQPQSRGIGLDIAPKAVIQKARAFYPPLITAHLVQQSTFKL